MDSLADALGISLSYQWSTETVDAEGQEDGGTHTSLAFNPDGLPSISYRHDTDEELRFAEYDGATWDKETVDTTGDVGEFSSLAYSPDGNAAISYHSDSSDSLKFAWRNTPGSIFLAYTVRAGGGGDIYGNWSELDFHPVNGRPYIVVRIRTFDAGRDQVREICLKRDPADIGGVSRS